MKAGFGGHLIPIRTHAPIEGCTRPLGEFFMGESRLIGEELEDPLTGFGVNPEFAGVRSGEIGRMRRPLVSEIVAAKSGSPGVQVSINDR